FGNVSGGSDRCAFGLVQIAGTCYAPRREGEACLQAHGHGVGCQSGLFCNSSLICERQRGAGAECHQNYSDCAPPLECSSGHLCSPPRLIGLGQSGCGNGASCMGALVCVAGVCLQPSQEGQSCQSVPCVPLLHCDGNKVCRKPSIAGEPCTNHVDCDVKHFFCDADQLCKPTKPVG